MSDLSKADGLDAHPAVLAEINNTLRTAGAALGLSASIIGKPDATAANPTGTGSTIGAGAPAATTPSSILLAIEQAGLSVGVPALKSIVATLAVKLPILTTQQDGEITAFIDNLIDHVVVGLTKAS